MEIWGDLDLCKVELYYVYKLYQVNCDRWWQVNYLVQVLVVLLNYVCLIGFLNKEYGNVVKGILFFKQSGEGWEFWFDDVCSEFEQLVMFCVCLVYEFLIGLGQCIGDMLKICWDYIKDGEYDFI